MQAFPTDTNFNPKSYVGVITVLVTEAFWPPSDFFINGANIITIREDAHMVICRQLLMIFFPSPNIAIFICFDTHFFLRYLDSFQG